jgi:hypothetical protein
MSRKPPWGDLFDGKPVERTAAKNSQVGDYAERMARADLVRRVMRVKSEHYGIEGETGSAWFELALKLAGELDKALTIVDPPKSDAVWLGGRGLALIRELEILDEQHGGAVKQDALFRMIKEEVQDDHPYYNMSPEAIKVAYHKACKHFNKPTIFQQRKKKSTG